MDWLKTRIAGSPKLARLIGQALFSVFAFLIVAGLIGRAGMLAINTTRAKANLPALRGLADAYPMYSLWFVPESAFGYILAAALAAFGIYIALIAKAVLKALNPRSRRRR
jgi:hypothetical protein